MSRRILLADDSVTIQKVIELTFMDDDYEVRAVGNGDEALAMLTALKVDFVIADVHMPGASGYEVCRRSKELLPEVPVLLLVGTFEPFDEAQARASGADSYLKKPFDSQELLGRVHELLGPAKPAPAAPLPAETPSASPSPTTTAGDAAGAPAAAPAAVPAAPPAAPAAAAAPPDGHTGLAGFGEPPAPAAAAAPPAGIEAAASWQEFELEAEPELIPEPWQAPRTAAAAVPAAAHESEQPFALGDLEEPEEQEALQVPEIPIAPGSEAPAAGAGTGGAAWPTLSIEPPVAAAHAAPQSPAGHGEATAAPPTHQPFTLGEPLDDRPFLLDEAEEAAALRAERLTTPEPIVPFPAFASGHPGSRPQAASAAAAGAAAADPAADASRAAAPAGEERAGAPVGQSPFSGSLHEAEERIAEHQPHPAFAEAPAASAGVAPAVAQAGGGADHVADIADTADAAETAHAVHAPDTAGLAAGGNGRSPSPPAPAAEAMSEADVDRIARRVVELIGDRVVRDIAWEVIPDLAEVVIKDRLRELESQIE
jgi:CheY-like chemotaxis protein